MSRLTTVTNEFCCMEMQTHLTYGEVAIVYIPKFREFGILYFDGGTSKQRIYYCPWCGTKLPESVADEWFETIWNRDLEPDSPDVPKEFLTDEWWKKKGL